MKVLQLRLWLDVANAGDYSYWLYIPAAGKK